MPLNLARTRQLLQIGVDGAETTVFAKLAGIPVILNPPGIATALPDIRRSMSPVLLRLGRDCLDTEEAMGPVHALRPDGIVLADCRGLADLQAADVALQVIEAEHAMTDGATAILVAFGGSPGALLSSASLKGGSRRLRGVILDTDALAHMLDCPDGAMGGRAAPLAYARARAVLMAADAGVPAFWTLPRNLTDPEALLQAFEAARNDGFTGVVSRSGQQWEALAAI